MVGTAFRIVLRTRDEWTTSVNSKLFAHPAKGASSDVLSGRLLAGRSAIVAFNSPVVLLSS